MHSEQELVKCLWPLATFVQLLPLSLHHTTCGAAYKSRDAIACKLDEYYGNK